MTAQPMPVLATSACRFTIQHIAEPYIVAEQRGEHYRWHLFNDRLHAQAWIVVVFRIKRTRRAYMTRPQDVHGERRRPDVDHLHEFTPAITQAMEEIEAGQINPHDYDFYAIADEPDTVIAQLEPDPFDRRTA